MSTESVIRELRRAARGGTAGAQQAPEPASPEPASPVPAPVSRQSVETSPGIEPGPPSAPMPAPDPLALHELAEPPEPVPIPDSNLFAADDPMASLVSQADEEAETEPSRGRRYSLGPIVKAASLSVLLIVAALVVNHVLLAGIGAIWWRTATAFILFGASGALIFSYALRAARDAGFVAETVAQPRRLLHDVMDADSQPRAVIGPDEALVHANRAYQALFRRYRAEGVNSLRMALTDNKTGLDELDRILDLAASGIRAQAEFELRDPASGAPDYRRVEAVPISGRAGYFILSVEQQTTDTVLVEQLRAEQKTFADFLENAPIGFFSVDERGRFVYMNETLANWLGLTHRDLTDGMVMLHNHIVGEGIKAGAPFDPFGGQSGAGEGEVIMRDMRGRQFAVHIIQRLESDPAGGVRTRSIVRDLTPERLWEQTLEQTKAKIESLLADAPVGVAVLDLQGRIREINPALRRMLGLEGQETEGAIFLDYIGNEAHDLFRSRFADVTQGRVSGEALEVPAKLHPETSLSLYLSRFGDGHEEDAGLFVHALDLSEQRRLEMQVSHSQKMQAIGQLAGGVAHDFNNLLTAMIGYCDLLLMRHRPGEQSFADITQIKQNANRAADLVRQLLAFSRQQTLKPKVLSITDVLTDLTHLLRRLVGANIELDVKHGRDLGRVRADQGQFEQVVVNLVVNARDAMLDGGTVEVRTRNIRIAQPVRYETDTLPAGDFVLVEVIDDGVGISKENLSRIFDPFFSTKKQGEGTGLGLSTVYGIVKQTGGHLFVESTVGQGTKFSIFLPAYEEKEGDEREAAPLARAGIENLGRDLTGAGTVMLVEDEEAVRQFSARALRNKGYEVVEEGTGRTAFDTLQGGKGADIDVLVTDIMMPDMDGTTLINEVRNRWPHIKIICISGYAEDTFREKIDQSDDVYFLPKPFNLSQLAGLVKDVMSTRAA